MSLKLAAQHLASKGRGPDTTLVHMAPQEVAGLQALARAHGGTLTTNPDTGLPEAGFLRAILPIVAGAALGPAGLGLTAMQAGLAAGALGTVATGSLKQGLMAGLGAYGGAGLMGSVAGAGEAALQAANSAPATGISVVPAPATTITPMAPPPVMPGADMATTLTTPVYPGTSGALGSGTSNIGAVDLQVPTGAPTAPTSMNSIMKAATPGPTMMTQPGLPEVVDRSSYGFMDKLKAGANAVYDDPSKLFNKDNMKYGLAAAAPLMFQEPEKRAEYQGGGSNPYAYEYDPGRQAYTPSAGSSEQAYFRPRYNLMADGGLAALAGGGASHLGDYSDGGRLLRGPGDGVSDDIPATIAGKRPARLADGEFVVPARIVSELGNGSTEAGARKLYAMMDRVQKNRSKTVGKNKVAVDSRSEKLLPA